MLSPHWGPVNAEIQVPSVENSELRDVLPLRLRVGQNIATHALPMAGNFLLILALTPEGRPGMSDVPSPVWNLRAVSWFPFPISSLVFFLSSPFALSVLSFFC